MGLREEAVCQFGPPVEEVLLDGGEGLGAQGPQQSVLAEERVVRKQAAHAALGHHVESQAALPGQDLLFSFGGTLLTDLYTPPSSGPAPPPVLFCAG